MPCSVNFASRDKWAALDSEEAVQEFPVLSKVQLEMITFGTYQLKQSKSYTKEHLSEDGEYTNDVHHLAPGLLRVRIQSSHINAKQYFCWIEYSEENTNEQIVAWFCRCKAGLLCPCGISDITLRVCTSPRAP